MRKRTGNIQDRGTSFRIRYYDADGLRHHESYATREEAERQLAIRLGELAAGLPASSKPNTVLFGELADDVVTDYEVNGFTSVDDIETRFRLHLVPVFGRRKAAQITTAQIKHYIKSRLADGAKPGTVNRELEAMRHAFKLAMQGRKLLHMPHVPMLAESNTRAGFFTREEVDRLCSHLKAPLDSFVLFGFLTGWRYSEIQNLRWSNVDFQAGEIRLDVGTDKNRAGRVFPMSAELRAMLTAISEAQKAKQLKVKPLRVPAAIALHVFQISGKPVGAFRKQWKTACHKAAIPGTIVEPVKKGGKPGAVKVLKPGRIFHDLRRSAVREFVKAGMSEAAAMKLSGHKTRSVFDRYNVVSEADLRDAVAKLDAKAKRASSGAGGS